MAEEAIMIHLRKHFISKSACSEAVRRHPVLLVLNIEASTPVTLAQHLR